MPNQLWASRGDPWFWHPRAPMKNLPPLTIEMIRATMESMSRQRPRPFPLFVSRSTATELLSDREIADLVECGDLLVVPDALWPRDRVGRDDETED